MHKHGLLVMIFALALLLCQGMASATGITDAELSEMFPPGSRIVENTVGYHPDMGHMNTEITVLIPYKNQGWDYEYEVQFICRRQILDVQREMLQTIVEQKLAQFADGTYDYWGTPLEFDEPGSYSEGEPVGGSIIQVTIDPPQKAEAAGGLVWYQRTSHGSQTFYNCHYVARVGDFVATLQTNVPGSRETADAWFEALLATCK